MAVTLAIVWFALSGKTSVLILSFGLGSLLLVLFLSVRMQVLDDEGFPNHIRVVPLLRYTGWLTIEVLKANIDVTRRILALGPGIDPVLIRVPAPQKTVVGRVVYANSITLTPGTVSIDLDNETIEVHALTQAGADDLRSGEMAARVNTVEGDVGGGEMDAKREVDGGGAGV